MITQKDEELIWALSSGIRVKAFAKKTNRSVKTIYWRIRKLHLATGCTTQELAIWWDYELFQEGLRAKGLRG